MNESAEAKDAAAVKSKMRVLNDDVAFRVLDFLSADEKFKLFVYCIIENMFFNDLLVWVLGPNGENVNMRSPNPQDGDTLLIWCSKHGYKNGVEVLIKAQANLDIIDNHDYTALAWATEKGFSDIAITLIDAGANVELKNILVKASYIGRLKIVECLINSDKESREINLDTQVDGGGETALMFAIEQNHTDVALALIAAGCDVSLVTKFNKYNALMYCVEKRNLEVFLEILNQIKGNMAFLNYRNEFIGANGLYERRTGACSVLMMTVNLNLMEFAGPLVQAGALLRDGMTEDTSELYTRSSPEMKTSISNAFKERQKEIRVLHEDSNTMIYPSLSRKDAGPLFYEASRWSDFETMKIILDMFTVSASSTSDAESVLNYQSRLDKYTALHYACRVGNEEVAEFLMEQPGIKCDLVDKDNNTVLYYAITRRMDDIAKKMKIKGVDNTLRNKDGNTLYHVVARMGSASLLSILRMRPPRAFSGFGTNPNPLPARPPRAQGGRRSRGVRRVTRQNPINERDHDGNTALMIAAENGSVEMVRIFITDMRCEVDTANASEETALIMAVRNEHVEVVSLLLEAYKAAHAKLTAEEEAESDDESSRYNLDAKDWTGTTALQYAVRQGHTIITKMLIESCHVTMASLKWASENGNREIVFALLEAGVDVSQAVVDCTHDDVIKNVLESAQVARDEMEAKVSAAASEMKEKVRAAVSAAREQENSEEKDGDDTEEEEKKEEDIPDVVELASDD